MAVDVSPLPPAPEPAGSVPATSALRSGVRAVRRRVRAQRGLNAAATALIPAAGTGALLAALDLAGRLGGAPTALWASGLALVPLLAGGVAAARPVSALRAARLLDETGGLAGRIAAAVDLLDDPDPGPFARAAIDDAARRPLSPASAAPFHRPPDLAAGVGMTAAALAVGLGLEVAAPPPDPGPPPPTLEALLLHPDDLDAQRAELEELLDQTADGTDAAREAAALNAILEDLADRKIDREEALRRLSELSDALDADTPGLEGVARALESLGDALADQGAPRPDPDGRPGPLASLGELRASLEAGDAARADRALRELADALDETAPSRAELARLRRALAAGADANPAEAEDDALRQAREERDRLLQRQRDAERDMSPRDRRLLERQRRELERLERQAMTGEQRRTLERLRRELEQSAEDLRRDPEDRSAAEALRRAAEELNRYAWEQLSQEQRERLARQVRQLRELLRRQREGQQGAPGEGDEGRRRRDRFVLRASGQDGDGVPLVMPRPGGGSGQPGGGDGQGQQGSGQGQNGSGNRPGGGQGQSQGQDGSGSTPGGQPGGGAGGGGGTGADQDGDGRPDALVLGQGGGDAEIVLPGGAQGGGQQSGGQGGGESGSQAGDGHDPTQLDDPTRLGGNRRTVQVAGEVGDGPSRSQVIRGAAARGFADRGYRNVYDDYRDHAEAVIESEEIPDGYRFYVRRYFQLIRPRSGDADDDDDDTP